MSSEELRSSVLNLYNRIFVLLENNTQRSGLNRNLGSKFVFKAFCSILISVPLFFFLFIINGDMRSQFYCYVQNDVTQTLLSTILHFSYIF